MKDACFKAYDIRGKIGLDIDNETCYKIARAYARVMKPKQVVVGFDARETSPIFAKYVMMGLKDEGVDVVNIGLSGTEEMYWATSETRSSGGIQITASHNPIDYNGMKMVKENSKPLESVSEFEKIKEMFCKEEFKEQTKKKGIVIDGVSSAKKAYVAKINSFASNKISKKLKVLVNSGNGAAGPTFDAVVKKYAKNNPLVTFTKIFHEPDSSFPNGIPNPMLKKNRQPTKQKILENSADLGIAFDGDFDRCFFFDEKGELIPGEVVIGTLAKVFLNNKKRSKIICDNRVYWSIRKDVEDSLGHLIVSRTGHTYIKRAMRKSNAIYGGEISSHHYFRDFAYCDSGMIPWILFIDFVNGLDEPVSKYIEKKRKKFQSIDEQNFSIQEPRIAIEKLKKFYSPLSPSIDYTDGVSFSFDIWRFNLRASNTEPVLRLNIEGSAGVDFLNDKLKEVTAVLRI